MPLETIVMDGLLSFLPCNHLFYQTKFACRFDALVPKVAETKLVADLMGQGYNVSYSLSVFSLNFACSSVSLPDAPLWWQVQIYNNPYDAL